MVVGNSAKRYDLLERIGAGSFGDVYLARDAQRDRTIALKFLHLDSTSPHFADAVALFKREFELLRELQHPNLACVHDFGFDAERRQYFFSAEYCLGKNLLESFAGKPVGFLEDVLVQMLSALDYIHAQGVIHSDIKPENILIEIREGAPLAKLLDFGVAGRLRGSSQGVGGSPAYMAPELLGPNPRVDARTDLYSLGMVALELLAGRLPFEKNDVGASREWHLSGTIPAGLWSSRDLPSYLRELIENLLKKNPSERFSNARVVLNFLNLGTGGRYQAAESALRAEIPLQGPLVERKKVLEGLQNKIRGLSVPESLSPAAAACFLCGERGIGKSRILEELRHFLNVQEIPAYSLVCDWEIPAWPQLAKALDLPAFAQDDLNRDWQIRRRVDALREAAKKSPYCLLIDDLHKADQDFRDTVLKLLETHPAEELQAPDRFLLVAAGEEVIEGGEELQRLSPQGVLQYVQGILGQEERTPELADFLYRYSGGLPLHVSEGLRYLAPRFLRGEALKAPPPNIAELYRDKISALNPAEQEILYAAALVFRPVPEAELGAMLRISSAELGTRAMRPLRLGLLNARSDAAAEDAFVTIYHMNSQALALGLIDGLEAERRQALHAAIAAGLQTEAPGSLEEIAYHLAKAGQTESAAQGFEAAAQALRVQGQVSNAARCFSKSIELLPEGSEAWQRLLTELARLFILSGGYAEAEAGLEKLAAYPSWQREELRGWLAFKRRNFPAAREHYQAALQGLGETPGVQHILIENALGNVDLQNGKPGEAAERFQKTLAWEAALPAEQREKVNNNNLGIALLLKGDEQGALDFYAEKTRRLEGRCKPEEEITLLNGKSYVCLQTGRYEETISHLKKAMQLAEQSGALHPLSSIMGNLITALIKESRYAESLPLLQKIVAFQTRLGNPRDVAYNLLRQGSMYLTLGMGEKAKACFESGKNYSEHSDINLTLWYALVEGYWEREHGSQDKAWEIFRELEAEADRRGIADIRAWAVYALADLAHEQNKIPECRRLLARVGASTQDREFLARLHLLEAKLAATERGGDSEKLFAEVEHECLEGHYREILWEVYHDWALTRERRQGAKAAQPLFEQGVHIVEAIVGSLPEEYRDRYRNQKMRKKLFEDWRHSQALPMEGMAARIKGFFGFTSPSISKK